MDAGNEIALGALIGDRFKGQVGNECQDRDQEASDHELLLMYE
jgi:hypothetical protein